ncbi:MAG: hypothetical protein PIR02_08800 [Microbacterium enclense]
MSGRTDESLAAEAARRRRELREEQDRHAVTRDVLTVTNRLLLTVYLRERLADPADFLMVVGMPVDDRGAIVWERVDVLVDELLRARPHFAAPEPVDGRVRSLGALQWFTERTVRATGPATATEARGQRTSDQGSVRHVESTPGDSP